MTDDLKNTLINIINILSSKYQLFASPVDWEKMEIIDYTKIIKDPMDLATLHNNVALDEYNFFFQFLSDAFLIFENCRKYNSTKPEYIQLANQAESEFIDMLAECRGLNFSTQVYQYAVKNQEQLSKINPNKVPELEPFPLDQAWQLPAIIENELNDAQKTIILDILGATKESTRIVTLTNAKNIKDAYKQLQQWGKTQ
ncbi:Bromodomain-containing_protein [Hexamita inflata]|uniref:Bromodomain-containing_protein n=1 Tax=Hexamita inflata TaxID=28002 RepID=A0ABP1HKC6_9EUKA